MKEKEAKEVAMANEKQRLSDLEIQRLKDELDQYKRDLEAAESEAEMTSNQLDKVMSANSQNEKQKSAAREMHAKAERQRKELHDAHEELRRQLEFEKEKTKTIGG